MSGAESQETVLVVDDTPANLDLLREVLRPHYRVRAALNGARALAMAEGDQPPDIILLDVMMPEMSGYEVCLRLKSNPATAAIPIIFVTAIGEEKDEQAGLELGAVDYIVKPIIPAIVLARVRAQLALYRQNRALEGLVQDRTRELARTRLEIIRRLGRAAEFRDNETGLHVIRMSHYSRLIAERLAIGDSLVTLLFNAAPMHDVGKIGISDTILLKRGPLADDEWAIMRGHPLIGGEIIGEDPSEIMQMSREIAIGHHEKWDGTGYPQKLSGEAIPLSARIIAVADVFDALTTERPYKKAWSVEDTLEFIKGQSGRHFEPRMVAALLDMLPEIFKIKTLYAEEGAPRNFNEIGLAVGG